MSELVTAIPTGIAAFTATNLDDIVILLLFFSQVNAAFRCRHIVAGQYLGFAALVLASLLGFFGGLILPERWIGLLGLVPIGIGLSRFLNPENDSEEEVQAEIDESDPSPFASFLSPQTYGVAAVTFANGGDNIGIYVPLFANSALPSLLVILSVFFLLVAVWCYTAYKLTALPAVADILTRYGNHFVPFVLIGLGVFIVLKNQSLSPLALVAASLCLMGLVKSSGRSTSEAQN
ncbi:cadmium resistance transporter [Planktothrix sp. FACHB-1355]|uniref:Cadmium resistance transporter n=1 Tax=Aerosakkonema funiforme FACHB-1375 TaxID=2949571 RepID=A0A926VBU1_9CYAN|nr:MULTISPECIES: cadmium resistance transporter [Oscillatoriales]MBD2180947.1 cadmium resistance transporter [Aerosakkonema funiforme FACHB-1375]MBD3559383.1 cadmium resistance transporter [Planktothrix sp. FACHB-1355]